jgi:uncharacterized protein (UPF0332 family)
MENIKWCLNVKNGLEIIDPNENISDSYLKMAEESLEMISKNFESKIWSASTAYYTMYYSLYSLMMRIGIKCEIHKCSMEFLRQFLFDFYNNEDINLIESGFQIRNDLQYYPGKFVDENKFQEVKKGASNFYIKTKTALANISNKKISEIREKLEYIKKTKNSARSNQKPPL